MGICPKSSEDDVFQPAKPSLFLLPLNDEALPSISRRKLKDDLNALDTGFINLMDAIGEQLLFKGRNPVVGGGQLSRQSLNLHFRRQLLLCARTLWINISGVN